MELKVQDFSVLFPQNNRFPPADAAFGPDKARLAKRFHNSLPFYAPTKLVALSDLAREYGIGGIFVKDESTRFGLKAFKGLGGSYAMFRILCEKLGLDPGEADFMTFQDPAVREACRRFRFYTATDGNHGKGVSWAAGLFGCDSFVFMPAGSSEARRRAIEEAGTAKAVITEGNYDEAVETARLEAEKNGGILIQDTAWEGYRQIPEWIIDGYLTLAAEAAGQLGGRVPTHLFLQAGVGAMAGGLLDYFRRLFPAQPPRTVLAEPREANCHYVSAQAADGEAHTVGGNPVTIMAGLNCGTPCLVTWPIIRDHSFAFCACDDIITREGMRTFAHPRGSDPAVTAGESGAVTLGLLLRILRDAALREAFGFTQDSNVLLINTEGDTDPDVYREIVSGQI